MVWSFICSQTQTRHHTKPRWHKVCISPVSSDSMPSWINCWVLEQTQPLSRKWTCVYRDVNPPWIPAIDCHLGPRCPATPATFSTFLLWCVYRAGYKPSALHWLFFPFTQRRALMELMWLSLGLDDGFLHILSSISHPFSLFSLSPLLELLCESPFSSCVKGTITNWNRGVNSQ